MVKFSDRYWVYAVFDGHGSDGHEVSSFLKDHLLKFIVRDGRFQTLDMENVLVDAFMKMNTAIATMDWAKKIDAQWSGVTSTVCIHDREKNILTFGHIGDTGCVLGSDKNVPKNKKAVAVELTQPHRPEQPAEKARIEESGGKVLFDGDRAHRVYMKRSNLPALKVSRCLGNILSCHQCGISFQGVGGSRHIALDEKVLILASSGVWEVLSPQDAIDIVMQSKPSQAVEATTKLLKEAWSRWMKEKNGIIDDVTAVVVFLGNGVQSP